MFLPSLLWAPFSGFAFLLAPVLGRPSLVPTSWAVPRMLSPLPLLKHEPFSRPGSRSLEWWRQHWGGGRIPWQSNGPAWEEIKGRCAECSLLHKHSEVERCVWVCLWGRGRVGGWAGLKNYVVMIEQINPPDLDSIGFTKLFHFCSITYSWQYLGQVGLHLLFVQRRNGGL